MGAAPLARRKRTITLEPITIEGKVPAKPAGGIPWKWILLLAAVGGGVWLLTRKKRRGARVRRPLAA